MFRSSVYRSHSIHLIIIIILKYYFYNIFLDEKKSIKYLLRRERTINSTMKPKYLRTVYVYLNSFSMFILSEQERNNTERNEMLLYRGSF